ncbi:CHAT domain-containing protein [uncultured Aquimarina sp.]|uniref:CHAT domain-containing protein n=1 Tax=uncultured Aquimarina sp. TaxID=575652 RepID=UPI00262217A6|nr:CHAT domain-containing protein [uncultured Aquimarina sp.]
MTKKIKIKDKKRKIDRNFPLFILLFICNLIQCQQISKTLDSLYTLDISESEKIQLYYQHLEKQEKTKDYTQLGSDAHQIAKWLHKNTVTKREAIDIQKKAVNARKNAKPFNSKLLKGSYYNLGLFSLRAERYIEAIEAYKNLASIDDSTDYLTGRAYLRIGDCYKELEDPYTAVQNHNNAFKFLQNNKRYLISNHINVAAAYELMRNKDDSKKAIKHLEIADSLTNLYSVGERKKNSLYIINNNLGGLYFHSVQDSTLSEKYYIKALTNIQNMQVEEYIVKTYYNLGLININRDNNKSLRYLELSLQNISKNSDFTKYPYFGLGILENTKRNYLKALEYYNLSLTNIFKTNITSYNINSILNKNKLSIIKDKMLLLEILKDITHNYINLGDEKKEDQFYQEAIKLTKISDLLIDIMLEDNISNDSKLLWRSIASGTYAAGIEACNKIKDIPYGFYLSEKHKALLLMQEIDKDTSQIPESILDKELAQKNRIIELQQLYTSNITQKNKDSISDLLFDKKARLGVFQDSLSTIYPNYFSNRNLPKIVPLSEITYNDNEIIIQYMMTERVGAIFPDTYCLVLSKNNKKLYQLENTKLLHDKIYDLRKRLDLSFRNKEDILSYQEKSYDLYTSLIPKEVRPLLKDKKVTIIPDHLINTIPFEALVADINSGKYLLEDCEISYTYSLSFEKQNESRTRNAQKEFLGIAPVNFSYELTSLRQSKKEISTANSYYSGSLLLDREATKENFIQEASNYKIIHLATHANASDSIAPWIAFRNQKMIDKELDLLKNQADLVVLSACNTSLGIVNSGEGVLSLARGFFKSGAKSVIPSLWSTNDKTTAIITSDFYKNLSEGQTKSAALRTAKLNYLHNNTDAEASPHYWASLVLIGDNGTLLPQPNNLLFLWIGLGLILVIMLGYFVFKKIR